MNDVEREGDESAQTADVPEADYIASITKPDYAAVRTMKRDRTRDVPEQS